MNSDVVVWGNCQAPPLADLLRAPLAAHGLAVVDVPPVYLVDTQDMHRVRAILRECAVLVSQPVSDEYRVPGCGTAQLAALLPAGARLVRLPVVYDLGAFPYQARGYDGAGRRVDAPVTDYHDLRVVLAAARGGTPPAADDDAVRAVAASSAAELRRREAGLDVVASDLLDAPDALWTITHPTNRVLAELARRVLAVLGVPGPVAVPAREYLGQRRAPLERDVIRARGWPPDAARADWVVDATAVPSAGLLARQLAFYRERPDVVTATLARNAARLRLLGMT